MSATEGGWISSALLVLGLGSAVMLAAAAETPYAWPGGAQAAVSLAYDDALDSQLDIALPALNRAGIKATFYLTLGSDTLKRRMADWRVAAAQGHELGNHTLFHQCSGSAPDRTWVSAETDLDTTSATRLVAQIRLGNTLLQAIDGRSERTFTAPCGDLMAQGSPYLGLIKRDFVAIKAGLGGVVPDMAALDPHAVNVVAPAEVSGDALIELVQRAARTGTMVSITFHGIGGDYLAVSSAAHEQLLRHLAANRSVYWTDTFLNIMKYVEARRATRSGAPALHQPPPSPPELSPPPPSLPPPQPSP